MDASTFELHRTFLTERLQGTADDFAPRASHSRQQLLGEARRAAILAFEQNLGQTAGDVAKGEVLDERQRFSESAGERASDGQGDTGSFGDEAQQIAPTQ